MVFVILTIIVNVDMTPTAYEEPWKGNFAQFNILS
jgi:hypothetical protein